jgi:uncharacterized surface protein with fasciclin (FAS1) repeats
MNCTYKFKSIFILPLLAISLLVTGCHDSMWEDHVEKEKLLNSNLVQVINTKSELSVFSTLLKKTGYDKVLELPNSYTVFAPANDAWSGVDTTNVDQVRRLISTLIVYKSYQTKDAELFTSVKAINGKNIFYDEASKTFNGAKITTPDLVVSNGVIQIMDKLIERRNNTWEYLSENTGYSQYSFIKSLDANVMDKEKSVAIGVEASTGKTKYDTVWTNMNNFLKKYPLDNEDSVYTYVVVENSGFDLLYNKYKKYFTQSTAAKTDSTTRYNVCQDFVFKGIVDISKFDTLVNVNGVKVPFKNVQISKSYNTSNGRVYVINESNIKLKEKIKPIFIEGENFSGTTDVNYVLTRYKRWASGERDVTLACGESQNDTLLRKLTGIRDSIVTKTYYVNSNLVANSTNFYIEYKAKVNSADYDIYYVAYDDISGHFDLTYTSPYGIYKVVQKLFMSMPGEKTLKYGTTGNTRGVANNYLTTATTNRCFVGQGVAGRKELTRLKQWNFADASQLLTTPVTTPDAVTPDPYLMTVPKTGELTMWLCNTARSNTASKQGLLFLDYIVLVPRINE